MSASRAANARRVEVSAFDEYVFRGFRHSRFEAAEYSGDAHRFFCVADHHVFVGKSALHSVERRELRPFRACADHDFPAAYLCEVEAMEGLAYAVENEIGDVDDIVDWTLSDGEKEVAKPFGRFLHLDVADCDA